MLGRIVGAVAVLACAAACAGVEPAGRNANRAPAPVARSAPPEQVAAPAPVVRAAPPPAATPAPQVVQQQAPPAAAPPAPAVVAQRVEAPPPRQAEAADDGDNTIVVPGGRDVVLPPPGGDPRSTAERVRDIRAWDQCVTRASATFEDDPMRPQLERPEDVCSRQLGMADRNAVPLSRREPRQ
ncbi:MAG: hypothetical protein AB7O98_02525 [Hyphomonadaceae bacterium]